MTQIVWMGFMEMFSTLKFKALHCFLFFLFFCHFSSEKEAEEAKAKR